MSQLTEEDYKNILVYYKKDIPKSKRLLKLQAETILSSKLCRCIKKVDKKNEARSIGICTKTIVNNKGFKRGEFTCKNKNKNRSKGTIKLIKIRKNKSVKNKK